MRDEDGPKVPRAPDHHEFVHQATRGGGAALAQEASQICEWDL